MHSLLFNVLKVLIVLCNIFLAVIDNVSLKSSALAVDGTAYSIISSKSIYYLCTGLLEVLHCVQVNPNLQTIRILQH